MTEGTIEAGQSQLIAEEKGGSTAPSVTVLPLAFITYLTLLPPQSGLDLGGIGLPFYRVGLIFLAPWILYVWGRTGNRIRPLDGMMLLAIAWIFVALSVTEGAQRALANGGSTAIDIGLAYFLARICLTSPNAFRRFLIFLAPAFLVMAVTILLETLGGRYIVQPFFIQIFGAAEEGFALGEGQVRYGLLRGAGPFPHPILAGLHLGSLLSLYALSALRGWPRPVGILASLGALFTLSSSALIMLAGQLGLIFYNYLSKIVAQATWRLFFILLTLLIVLTELSSNRGAIRVFTELIALNSWTAYYRTLIWDYGLDNVFANPVFGIGFADWVRPAWMPPSVDNYWLLIAMQYGVLEALLRFSVPFAAACLVARYSSNLSEPDQSLLRGLAISLMLFTLLGFSVALWNNTQAWFNIVTGAAVSLAYYARNAALQATPAAALHSDAGS